MNLHFGFGSGTSTNTDGFSHRSGSIDEPHIVTDFKNAVTNAGFRAGSTISGLFDTAKGLVSGNGSSWNDMYGKGYSPFGAGVSSGASAAGAVEYPFANITTLYGGDAKSAYQEALANTAVQRRMEDLKRSGINPVLAAQGQGADTVKTVGNVTYGAPAAGSGSGSSYEDWSSSAAGTSSKSLSDFTKFIITNRNAASTVASIASGAVFLKTKSFPFAASAYYAVNTAGDIIRNMFK